MARTITPATASSPQEVAAVTAVITLISQPVPVAAVAEDRVPAWVKASRLASTRAGLQRGPWRLSGRIGRRARA